MKTLYIVLNSIAALLLIPASNLVWLILFIPIEIDVARNDFFPALIRILTGFLIFFIPAGMLLAFSYWQLQNQKLSIRILSVTIVVACLLLGSFQLTNELFKPAYELLYPGWLMNWLAPGYSPY